MSLIHTQKEELATVVQKTSQNVKALEAYRKLLQAIDADEKQIAFAQVRELKKARELGLMLLAINPHAKKQTGDSNHLESPLRLEDLVINKHDSSYYQNLAKLTDEEFQTWLDWAEDGQVIKEGNRFLFKIENPENPEWTAWIWVRHVKLFEGRA